MTSLEQIAEGRTDLVFEYLAEGHSARDTDADGVSLAKWCAYYGDVSAIRIRPDYRGIEANLQGRPDV